MSGSVAERLAERGWIVPTPAEPLGHYVPATRFGTLVFTSGQLPLVDGALLTSGRVGAEVPEEVAVECARLCALNILSAASSVCDLDSVVGVLRLTGYVACPHDYVRQPAVINGASEVMAVAFGESGQHAREAIGVASLPMGAPVEVSAILAVSA